MLVVRRGIRACHRYIRLNLCSLLHINLADIHRNSHRSRSRPKPTIRPHLHPTRTHLSPPTTAKMRYTAALIALLATAMATPTPTTSNILQMRSDLRRSDACIMPTPGNNCAGATMKDVIVEFPTGIAKDKQTMMIGAVKNAGGTILYDWNDFGFSAYIPEQVLTLMKAHGDTFGMKVFDNACAEIPWCGEAPC
ncbi:uncharacterized protein BDR25DRAFT_341657 [Lindgomyces ingoldianus]|uniref:Uncharacterized protein n=1 Tax=Lindgomyces ingoldianus TaxID=673940 RepID=A0ACB6R0N5_9PLEO|nr:uncharacterized protein BDR25DRAFT_341657 [Lindgomyces ingoldianus]KAF2472854.1 hypothetical protein BDR25DRAFT_341657 [Lindgomyces ingoldianus]